MSYVVAQSDFRAPLVSGWDFGAVPLYWPGQEAEPPIPTEQMHAPAKWVVAQFAQVAGAYLSSAEDLQTWELRFSILVEPNADESHARKIADDLAALYGAATSTRAVFRVAEAILDPFGEDAGWNRWDWILVAWYFDPQGGAS